MSPSQFITKWPFFLTHIKYMFHSRLLVNVKAQFSNTTALFHQLFLTSFYNIVDLLTLILLFLCLSIYFNSKQINDDGLGCIIMRMQQKKIHLTTVYLFYCIVVSMIIIKTTKKVVISNGIATLYIGGGKLPDYFKHRF